jgi:AcrR family transcriptional regulator
MDLFTRRQRDRDDLKGRILEAARELFVTEGYEATSMRRIGQKVGYTAMALYRHFPGKFELMQALCVEDFATLRRAMDGTSEVADPIERIRAMGRAYVSFGLSFPMQYRLIFMTPHIHDVPPPPAAGLGDPGRDTYALLLSTVEAARAAGRFRDEHADAELLTQVLWGALHGVVAQQIALGDDPAIAWRPIERRAEMVVDALLNGLTAPTSTPASTRDRSKYRSVQP